MQVTETLAEGLKREFKVVVAASDIEARVDKKLNEVGQQVRVPGFRPGKVPQTVLKQRFGGAVMGEVIEQAVSESANQALTDNELRPAMQPKIEIDKFEDGTDLEYTMSVEVLPDFELMDLKAIKLTRLKVKVTDEEVDEALQRLAQGRQDSEPADKDHAAAEGDIAVVDFEGSIDGEAFAGGKAEGHYLQIGSGAFVPGFEEQLVGAKAGEKKNIQVTFPEDYRAEALAGKTADFAVEVKEVRRAKPVEIDDDFAKGLGVEDLNALKDMVRDDIENNYGAMSRQRLKRDLLDALAEGHDFELPQGMVDTEFEEVWKQVEERRKNDELDPGEKEKSEDELKAEYQDISARRVRLGLVLSEVGNRNEISVGQDEISRAIAQEAQRYPGRERDVMELYQKSEAARNTLRGPIYEDKVVDFILELAGIEEKESTIEDVLADPEEARDPPKIAKKPNPVRSAKSKPKKTA